MIVQVLGQIRSRYLTVNQHDSHIKQIATHCLHSDPATLRSSIHKQRLFLERLARKFLGRWTEHSLSPVLRFWSLSKYKATPCEMFSERDSEKEVPLYHNSLSNKYIYQVYHGVNYESTARAFSRNFLMAESWVNNLQLVIVFLRARKIVRKCNCEQYLC